MIPGIRPERGSAAVSGLAQRILGLKLKAHEAVHCAAEQGKRREMHKKIFANQRAMR